MKKNKEHKSQFEEMKRLTTKDIKDILDKFAKFGLRADEDLEYFTLQLANKKVFIPKRDILNIKNGSDSINSVNITKHIYDILVRELGPNFEVQNQDNSLKDSMTPVS